jgi:hypothetical protein
MFSALPRSDASILVCPPILASHWPVFAGSNSGTVAARFFAIVAPRLETAGRRHPPNACCLARSAVREACELRGRSVERLCHGFALELAGDHPGLDGVDLALLAEPELAATAYKTTLDLR